MALRRRTANRNSRDLALRLGRTLQPHVEEDLSTIEVFLADNEILDPESPAEMFETMSNRGLSRDWIK